jgi:zinc protease
MPPTLRRWAWLGVCAAAGVAAQSRDLPPLTVFSDLTESGLEVHIVEIPQSPAVAVRVYVRGGTFGEDRHRGAGLSFAAQTHVAALLEDARRAASNAPYRGTLSSGTMHDAVWFGALTTPANLRDVLRELADAMADRSFTPAQWQRTRSRVSRVLRDDQHDTAYQLDSLFRRTAYMWNPVRFPVRGELSLFLTLTRADLLRYHERCFVAGNVLVVVAGDLDAAATTKAVEQAFAVLPRRSAALPPNYEDPLQTSPRWLGRFAAVSQSYVCVGCVAAPEGHADEASLELLAGILASQDECLTAEIGGWPGAIFDLQFRLLETPRTRGAFIMTFQAPPRTAPGAARRAGEWLLSLADYEFDDARLAAQAALLRTDYVRAISLPAHAAEQVGAGALRLGNPGHPRLRAERWLNVSAAEAARACRRVFRPEHLSTVILSPPPDTDAGDEFLLAERGLLGDTALPVRRVSLDNGVTLVLRPDPQNAAARVMFAAVGGLWCESPRENGAFALLGQVMRTATAESDRARFTADLRAAGVQPHCAVHPQMFSFAALCAPAVVEDVVQLMSEAWSTPRLDRDTVDLARGRIVQTLAAKTTNVPALADLTFRASLFSMQPYQMNRHGSLDTLLGLAPRDLARVHNDFVTPRNTAIVVSGAFNEQRVIAAARRALRLFREQEKSDMFIRSGTRFNLQSGHPYVTVNLLPEPQHTNAITRLYASPLDVSLVVSGSRLPPRQDTNFPPGCVDILCAALNGELQQLRDSWRDDDDLPVVSGAGAHGYRGLDTGWAYCWITVPEGYTREAATRVPGLFQEVVKRLASPEYLARARKRAVAEQRMSESYQDDVVDMLARGCVFNYAERYPRTWAYYLNQYTPSRFNAIARDYAARPVTAVVAPAE